MRPCSFMAAFSITHDLCLYTGANKTYSQPPICVLAVFFLPWQSRCVLHDTATNNTAAHNTMAVSRLIDKLVFIWL